MPWIVAVLTVLGLSGAGWFYVVHPADLPRSDGEQTARTPTGVPVYVGVLRTDRTIHISGVRMAAEASVEDASVELLLCEGGDLQVTSDPAVFCRELRDPSGADLGPEDTLVAEVQGTRPGAVYLRQPRISFTDGLQRGTTTAGSPAVVTIVER